MCYICCKKVGFYGYSVGSCISSETLSHCYDSFCWEIKTLVETSAWFAQHLWGLWKQKSSQRVVVKPFVFTDHRNESWLGHQSSLGLEANTLLESTWYWQSCLVEIVQLLLVIAQKSGMHLPSGDTRRHTVRSAGKLLVEVKPVVQCMSDLGTRLQTHCVRRMQEGMHESIGKLPG